MSLQIDRMALVRTIRPWDGVLYRDHTQDMEAIEANFRLNFDNVDSVYVPVTNDDSAGRMAFYLAKVMKERGINTLTPDNPAFNELEDVIDHTRVLPELAPQAIPLMLQLANRAMNQSESLSSMFKNTFARKRKVGNKALLVVTSEPFIVGTLRHQQAVRGVPHQEQTKLVQPGELVPVDIEAFTSPS